MEHLVEVWLKLKCNIYVQLMLICIECSLKLPLNSPCRTGLNGAFDVHYSRVEHLVEVWLKLKCNINVQLMLICIECSL